jgi:hypothetical protein
MGGEFFSSPPRPDRLLGPPASYPLGTKRSYPVSKASGAWSWPNLTLVLRLRMREAIPPFSQYVLMASCLIKQWIRPYGWYLVKHKENLGPTQPSIQCVPGALSLGVKWPGRESDPSSPSSDEVKNAWSYNSPPHYASMAWCSVKKSTGTTFPKAEETRTLWPLAGYTRFDKNRKYWNKWRWGDYCR